MLGLTVFATQFPSFIFSLYGGIISDRYNRYKILLVTQILSLIQASLLAFFVLMGYMNVWLLIGLSVVLGVINAFDIPARQPLVNNLINQPEDLPNAIALNSSMVNLARLVGPALSGIILAKWGAGICFLINAISFVAVITSLLLMKLDIKPHTHIPKKATEELAEGFRYLIRTREIGMLVLLLAILNLFVFPYNTLMPVFAQDIFSGDARTFGYLNSAIGLGAISGTLFIASRKPGANLKRIIISNLAILGSCLILFSMMTDFHFALIFIMIAGFGTISNSTIGNTIIQMRSSNEMRGRMISYATLARTGMLPLGGLLVGAISEKIGTPTTVLIEGVLALIIVIIFFRFLKTTNK